MLALANFGFAAFLSSELLATEGLFLKSSMGNTGLFSALGMTAALSESSFSVFTVADCVVVDNNNENEVDDNEDDADDSVAVIAVIAAVTATVTAVVAIFAGGGGGGDDDAVGDKDSGNDCTVSRASRSAARLRRARALMIL